jgi:replication fork protection complex subunit Tof1/Swi1
MSDRLLATDADELEWYVPAAITPRDLQTTLGVVRKYVAAPFEVDGKQASALLKKKAIRRRRRRSSPSDSDADGDAEGDVDDEKKKARKGKRKKEKEVYKSAATIADSDEEYADMDAFLEKEKALREKTARIQGDGGRLPTMKSAGTKKRTRPREAADKAAGKQKRRRGVDDVISNGDSDRADSGVLPERTGGSPHPDSVPDTNSPSSTNGLTMFASSSRVIARGGDLGSEGSADEDSERLRVVESRRRRIVISDDDE